MCSVTQGRIESEGWREERGGGERCDAWKRQTAQTEGFGNTWAARTKRDRWTVERGGCQAWVALLQGNRYTYLYILIYTHTHTLASLGSLTHFYLKRHYNKLH